MELTKPHIKRIDSFLERLGCEYIDVRFEMVDHIATDIEQKITDQDKFFKKNKMRGEFLLYMISKKEDFENSYYKQSKKKFWNDLVQIIKSILKEIINIKHLLFIAFLFMVLQYFLQKNVIHTAFLALSISALSYVYSLYILNKEVKKYGKLRLVHSFISLSTFPLLMMNPIYNFSALINNDCSIDMAYILSYYYLIYFIFNALLTIVFIKRKNEFKIKYKYLMC